MTEHAHIIEDLRQHAHPVDDLVEDPSNANQHPDKNLRAIRDSLEEFGQRQVILARKDNNVVVAGNGRLRAARQLGWDHIACVFVDDDEITAMRYAIADNRSSELSVWDPEALTQMLDAIDRETGSLDATGFDYEDLDTMIAELEDGDGLDGPGGDPEKYSQKIQPPIYEPSADEPPSVDEMYDPSRTEELLDEIAKADLPDDLARFLEAAATRHTSFMFSRIAEYYAHASPEVQDLMERSALVVIDFDRAIEEGFVQMSNRLAELAQIEEDHREG